jgi:hypothetical protein
MEETRELIAAFREINGTSDRSVARFTPALIGMFGSARMFDIFLASLDDAITSGQTTAALKERVTNLRRTFIPQVAALNGITDLAAVGVSARELRAIRSDSPESRRHGAQMILASLMAILDKIQRIG